MLGALAQTSGDIITAGGIAWGTYILFYLGFLIVYAIGAWKMYEKAGQPGWACLIPIYNFYVLCKIVGRPGWWVILLFIPFVNVVIWIIVALDLAKSFGKGTGFAIGLIFLSVIFIMILGFGDDRYVGPAAAPGGMALGGGTPPPPPPPPA
jgi:hypothetical protein